MVPAFTLGKTTCLLQFSQTWDNLLSDPINYVSPGDHFEYLMVQIYLRFV